MAPPQGNGEEEEKRQDPEDGIIEKVVDANAEKNGAEDDTEEEDNDKDASQKKKRHMTVAADAPWKDRMWEVFTTFWPLGLVCVYWRNYNRKSYLHPS